MSAPEDNRPRFRSGTDHVESWFVRANDPGSPRALWLKATVLTRADGTSIAEAWCSVFDGTRTAAFRHHVPLAEAAFDRDAVGLGARVGTLAMALTEDGGSSRGRLTGDGGEVAWDLAFERLPGALGRPMRLPGGLDALPRHLEQLFLAARPHQGHRCGVAIENGSGRRIE